MIRVFYWELLAILLGATGAAFLAWSTITGSSTVGRVSIASLLVATFAGGVGVQRRNNVKAIDDEIRSLTKGRG